MGTILSSFLLAAIIPLLQAQGPVPPQIEANPLSSGHIRSVTGIGKVYGDGLKLSAIAIEMDREAKNGGLKVNDFSVDLTGNTLPASGTVKRIYTNSRAEMSKKGMDGKYVILEMDVEGWLPVSGEAPEIQTLENLRSGSAAQRNRPQPPKTDFLSDVSLRGNPDAHPSIRLSNRHGGQGFTFSVRQEKPLKAVGGAMMDPDGQWVDNEKDLTLVLDGFAKPDFHNEETGITSKFNLFVPYGYDPSKEYPLVVYLHDEYACWNRHDEPLISGKGASLWAEPQMQERQEAFVLVPVYKRTFLTSDDIHETGLDETMSLIDKVLSTFNIDRKRLYLVGQGANAAAAMVLMRERPSFYAGAICVAGAWNGTGGYDTLRNENILFVATEGDSDGVQAIESCLEKLGGTGGHIIYRKSAAKKIVPKGFERNPLNCRIFTLRRAYEDGTLAEWLYSRRRPDGITGNNIIH